ncbi:MAG: YqaA family protein [Candidatus Hydrothermarchaeaceae archaeon]
MFEFFLSWAENFVQNYGLVGLFIVMIVGSSPIPIPVEVIALSMIALGAQPTHTALFAALGATLGGTITYFIGAGIVNIANFREKHKDRMKTAKLWLDRYGFFAVFTFALIPLGFDAIALAAGGARMKMVRFVLALLAGRVIRYVIIFKTGHGLLELIG